MLAGRDFSRSLSVWAVWVLRRWVRISEGFEGPGVADLGGFTGIDC